MYYRLSKNCVRYGVSNKENSLISLIILWQTHEASKVFEHLVSLGLKPNAKSYSLIIEAHLINRDVKSALAVIDDMVSTLFFFFFKKCIYLPAKLIDVYQIPWQMSAGFEPSKLILKMVRRRCMREMDYESDDRVQSLANSLNYRLGSEARRDILFNLDYSGGYA